MNELVSAYAEAMREADRASRGLGMRPDAVAPGRTRLSLTITDAMANGLDICHGGCIISLADSAAPCASNQDGDAAVAQHAMVSFVRPGWAGQVPAAEAV